MRIHTLTQLSLLLVGLSVSANAQSLVPCGRTDIATPGIMLTGLRQLLSDTTQDASVFRYMAKLPQVSESSVNLVSDPVVCDAAARAVAAHRGAETLPESVWVIEVGSTRYVAFGRIRSAGRGIASTFDASFTWLTDFVH